LSPRLGPRKKSAGEAFEVGDEAVKFRSGRRRGRRNSDMGVLFMRAVYFHLSRSNLHAAQRVPDPPLATSPPFPLSPFRESRDPRRKELIGGHAEKGGDFVHVAQLQFLTLAIEKAGHPGPMFLERKRQV
jgi:hypothetical protein